MKYISSLYYIFLFLVIYTSSSEPIDLKGGQWLTLSIVNAIFIGIILIKGKKITLNNLVVNPFLKYFGIFFIVASISSLWAINQIESLVRLTDLFTILSTLLITTYFYISKEVNVKLILSLFSISLFLDLYATVSQYLAITGGGDFDFSEANNIRGFYGNKNITAAAIAFKIPLVIYLSLNLKSKLIKPVLFLLVTVAFFSIYLISARAVFVSLALSVIFLVILYIYSLYRKKRHVNYILAFVIPLLISLAFFNVIEGNPEESLAIDNRIDSIINNESDQSTAQRLRFYTSAFNHFLSNPIIGCGIGNWKILSIKYESENLYSYVVPYFTHNDILEIFAETGLIGGIPFLLFLFYIFKINYKNLKLWIENDRNKNLILLTIPLIIYFVDLNLNFPLDRPSMQIYLLLYILIIQKLNLEANEKN